MKTSLKIIALIAAAVYPVGALAEVAGFSLPSSFTPEYVVTLFVASLFGLTFFSDYSRRARDIDLTPASVIVPPADTFADRNGCPDKSECLAA
ncbi:MAG: hypothetical protein JSR48_16100 [Verrucomicrobia bacterium]|nr:hypothetical protein [Verrucomicrobiota bacterium]